MIYVSEAGPFPLSLENVLANDMTKLVFETKFTNYTHLFCSTSHIPHSFFRVRL